MKPTSHLQHDVRAELARGVRRLATVLASIWLLLAGSALAAQTAQPLLAGASHQVRMPIDFRYSLVATDPRP